jgi:ferric-dicitrate binding protein FerR (iron transport regulator)
MESKDLHKLIEKFLSDTATTEEIEELNQWYRDKNNHDVIWEQDTPDEEELINQRLLGKLEQYVDQEQSITRNHRIRRLSRLVAAACLVLIGSFAVYIFNRNDDVTDTVLASTDHIENRFVLLPDSSKVILRPGAKIEYHYTEAEREVFLTGEAFFDVTHNKLKPFLVHAGAITTRVLGTSFNIAAYSPEDVVVSVSTGKVAVQDRTHKTLVVLKPNQQLQYKPNQPLIAAKQVEMKALTSWVNRDMQFSEIPFGALINSLSKRYQTKFEFENENLKNCLVTGVFDGTESLESVLTILTKMIGGSYKWDGEKIRLRGNGCIN